jgi:hypothetical protein
MAPEDRERFDRMMMERSPAERMRMAADMHDTAKRIVLASLPEGMSEGERACALLRRFYSDDFDEATMSRIERALLRSRGEAVGRHAR